MPGPPSALASSFSNEVMRHTILIVLSSLSSSTSLPNSSFQTLLLLFMTFRADPANPSFLLLVVLFFFLQLFGDPFWRTTPFSPVCFIDLFAKVTKNGTNTCFPSLTKEGHNS